VGVPLWCVWCEGNMSLNGTPLEQANYFMGSLIVASAAR